MKTDTFGQGIKCQVFYRAPVLALWSNELLIALSMLAVLNCDTQIVRKMVGVNHLPHLPFLMLLRTYNTI